ncbi:ABC transporter ATP-binding protein [Ligilactobacillus araffinosus]|uniref:ABC transporter ATP binding protein n=1 Tax=Ligilactobacillus araffinosus DSM 20653 TaxID=1423820 RepID=A0A0R1ZBE2_9LACO|nr:ATP-binding cassette domain-containing protein [Ligilactobacillus araffinosus]KRM52071.1 ABC transporter ATP binding protein [Ligilactobacillus araffinosus DSM 20653]
MIELRHVSRNFNGKTAVDDLNFKLYPGETLGIIGQNGAGKSTTFRMIMGFISPSKGQILINNKLIDEKVRGTFGFMPEERGLYQNETIINQMTYFGELHGMSHLNLRTNLRKWMKKLDVVGNFNDKIKDLSKGNAQKIQLIAVLMFEPRLIILDEPFSGLDPVNAELLNDAILESKRKGSMIIFSSHSMENVEKVSDKILMLKHGKTVLNDEIKNIYKGFIREYLTINGVQNTEFFKKYNGVSDIKQMKNGNIKMKLVNERIGRIIFKDIVKEYGYVPLFNQSYPSLEEIFKRKAVD